MSTLRRRAVLFSLILVFASGSAWAQAACPLDPDDAINKAAAGKELMEDIAETPLAASSPTQVEAPSSSGGGALVNLPGFASLLGLAQEQGLIDRKDGVTAVSLTPFSFLALLQPRYYYDQQAYDEVRWLRRWGGQVAFGGKGDGLDQDGDGTVDEALVAENPNDIVTWEVKYQFGSRDRRDKEVYQKYFDAIRSTLQNPASSVAQQNADAFADASEAITNALANKPLNADECYAVSDIREALHTPEVASAVARLRASDEELEKVKGAFEDVDRRPILTLVYGGTERKDEFGADKRSAALRGAFTWLGGTNSAELSWSKVESLLELENAVTWKLGYNYSRSFLKGAALSKDGVTLAVAGSYEKLQDVPMAAHDTISKLNAKFSIPVTEGMEIPISVTWANHKDLITDEDEVQGHIGFTVDYSKVRDQILGKK